MPLLRRVPALALSAAVCATTLLGPAGPAAAAGYPDTIPLPPASSPEGIAGGPGSTFFAGSRVDGSIVRGDLRTGVSAPFVAGTPGDVAVGMVYDQRRTLLWVAGGRTGTVTAYDGRTGEQVVRYRVPGTGFLNDVVVTRDAVYVTDSANAQLVVVPLGRGRALPSQATTLPLSGQYVQPAGFGANGIRELPGGDLVLVSGAVLYRVGPDTGAATRIVLQGRQLTGGDGLELRGTTLYVVYGFGRSQPGPGNDDSVAVVRLDLARGTGRVVDELTSPLADRPTTGTLGPAGSIWVVNGRFDTPSATSFDIVRIRRR